MSAKPHMPSDPVLLLAANATGCLRRCMSIWKAIESLMYLADARCCTECLGNSAGSFATSTAFSLVWICALVPMLPAAAQYLPKYVGSQAI